MNVLYLLGSLPSHKHFFINRELRELQNSGLNIYLLVIHPFSQNKEEGPIKKIFKPGINPLQLLISPFINYFSYGKSLLFSKNKYSYNTAFNPDKISKFRVLTAAFFLESSLNKLLKSKVKFDHIHCHHLFSAALFTPTIAEITGASYSISLHTLSYYFKDNTLNKTLNDAAFLRGVTSETVKFYGNISKKKIQYIANGVEESQPSKKDKTNENKKLSILAVGYFLDKKGFDVLIKSCQIIQKEGFVFTCTIIGEGPEKDYFKSLIKKLKLEICIQLIPFMNYEALVPYFQKSTLLAVPCRDPKRSTRDGLPTVILEAMDNGLPVIASNFAGISDAIEHEKTGLLIKPESEEELASAILRIYGNTELRNQIIKNSSILVKKNFSLQKNMAKLAKLIAQEGHNA